MGLSIRDRVIVDKIIDEAVTLVPGSMKMYRGENLKTYYQYDKVEDFVFGMCYGYIQSGFSHLYRLDNNELPTHEQISEFVTVFNNRMREVRDAIFKTG